MLRGTVLGCLIGLGLALSPGVLGRNDAEALPDQTIELDEPAVAAPSFSHATVPPFRAHFGHAELYLSTFFHPVDGRYDLLVHFHGMSSVQEWNVERSHLNAAVVSVNIGMGSGPYEEAFRDPGTFGRLVTYTQKLIDKSGRAKGAHLGRLAVSAWSAGYGSVASILRQPQNTSRLDAVLLEDAPHSDWATKKHDAVDDAPLAKYQHVAEAAIAGQKLFALTHSAIPTEGYPSTTETIGELLRLVGVDKTPHEAVGPREMQQIYQADRGDFHVKGYEGVHVKDHVDHIRAMGDTLLPYLKARWEH